MKPTYQEILFTLLCASMNLPSDWQEVNQWCVDHGLLVRVKVAPEHLWSLALTNTGEMLLGQNLHDFKTHLFALHKDGHLTAKANYGTQEDRDHDTQQQEHDGSKGKAPKGKQVKDHAARYGRS